MLAKKIKNWIGHSGFGDQDLSSNNYKAKEDKDIFSKINVNFQEINNSEKYKTEYYKK